MAITLNHTIVPARDKEESARFFAEILGLERGALFGPFAPVRVGETLTLDFADSQAFEPHHYAFLVSDEELDAIFARARGASIAYSSDPHFADLGQMNHRRGGRGFYFRDPNGHILEVMTRG